MIEEEKTIARIMEEKEEEEERFRKDANKEGLRSYHRSQRGICTKKREDISIIKSRKRESVEVCKGSVEERVY